MGRYWDILREGAARERNNKRPALSNDERLFQAAAIEILETPASPTSRILGAAIVTLVCVAVAWSWFGRIETYAVVQGKIIPVGKVQVIEPLITGTVKAIHVRAGDQVTAGDTLLEIDPAGYATDRKKLADSLLVAEVSYSRLRAIIRAVSLDLPASEARLDVPAGAQPLLVELQSLQMRQSLSAYQAEQTSIAADVEQKRVEIQRGRQVLVERQKLVGLSSDRLDIFMQLEKKGVGIKSNTIAARQGEQDQLLALVIDEGRLAELEAAVATMTARKRERKEAYLDRIATELIEVDREISVLRQDLTKAQILESSSSLKSPVSGLVQQVEVNTVGQVVQTGQRLMVVVPNGTELEIDGMLLNRDKGFVSVGQNARVKLEAFSFAKYGTVSGRVLLVSNDAVSGAVPNESAQGPSPNQGPLVFPIRISLDRGSMQIEGQIVDLTSGMAATAEIRIGNRRIIEYLLDPLVEVADGAFHEK